MNDPLPLAQDVVLVGGGHAHALFLREWGMKPVPGARLTVINPAPTAPYTGMLPGHVAGHYDRDELEIDLVRLARFAGARLVLGRAEGLDLAARHVLVPGRPPVAWDILSLDIGITSELPGLPGFEPHGVAAKPLGRFARSWRDFLDGDGPGDVAVIGAGLGGAELALAMTHALAERGRGGRRTIVDASQAAAGLAARSRKRLLAELAGAGIELVEGIGVARLEEGAVVLENGRRIPSAFTVGAAGARPHGWLAETGLDLTDGFVTVDETLGSVSDARVFAAGDCAHLSHDPRPKAGVFAVRAAPVLYDNIRAELVGGRRRAFRPQRDYLKLVSLGRKAAILDRPPISLAGGWAWRLKDRIDRRFMARLRDLPVMKPPAVPQDATLGTREALGPKPLCGGCGAKVGSDALGEVIARLPKPTRPDVLSEPGDDAAVLGIGDARLVITTDHLRAFWSDPVVMTRIAAVHALGDIWAMGAEPQAALVQITLPHMAVGLQRRWLAEIMSTAHDVFSDEGAAVVGGHTTLGPEFQIGFTVTGRVPEGGPVEVSGGRDGDALILTRPIGSGTLLAAEMAGAARGDDVAAALDAMSRSQGAAARLLASRAHAMTDVTGFGLAGHLSNLARASGLAASVEPGAVPLFAGAEALAEAGHRSSLFESNRSATPADLPDTPRAALLFDPQTSGGLLAVVDPGDVDGLLADLGRDGTRAVRIGRLEAGPPGLVTSGRGGRG